MSDEKASKNNPTHAVADEYEVHLVKYSLRVGRVREPHRIVELGGALIYIEMSGVCGSVVAAEKYRGVAKAFVSCDEVGPVLMWAIA